jgi:5-formyltetrahydrofolate cyclo-ligase
MILFETTLFVKPSNEVAMKKDELRKLYLQKRKLMTPEERTFLSKRIVNLFFKRLYSKNLAHIHLFLPIHKLNEVDTWLIVEEFKEKKLPTKLVISKSDMKSGLMTNYFFNPQDRLLENKWGIPEPVTGEICDNVWIDLVLTPLLAFDRKGHRIGYGKGFYDRFLQSCRQDALKIGLSYDGPVESIEDTGENDISLDCVITPNKLYWFK